MILLLETLDLSQVKANQIKIWTHHDPFFSKVRDQILQGWHPHADDAVLALYLSHQPGVQCAWWYVLWGSHVVVPPAGQKKVNEELHEATVR